LVSVVVTIIKTLAVYSFYYSNSNFCYSYVELKVIAALNRDVCIYLL